MKNGGIKNNWTATEQQTQQTIGLLQVVGWKGFWERVTFYCYRYKKIRWSVWAFPERNGKYIGWLVAIPVVTVKFHMADG